MSAASTCDAWKLIGGVAGGSPSVLGFVRSLLWHGPQESVKTKHPQLLYESKLYKILQGGGKLQQEFS